MTNGAADFWSEEGEEQKLSSLWRDRYGLAGDPFMDHPDFFFTGAQRQHHLETLSHLAVFGDMVLLVTGDSGAGKTRLLAEFVRQSRPRLEIHRVKSVALTDGARLPELLARLSGEPLMGLEPEKASEQFFKWSEQKAQRDRRWVLVMDNADAASDQALNALVNGFRAADTSSAAVLMFAGSPGLTERLPIPLTDESAFYEVRLSPLDDEELQHFVQASFDHVGGDAQEFLDSSSLAAISARSKGNMKRVREVAPAILLGYERSEKSSPSAGPTGSIKPLAKVLQAGLGRRQRLWAATMLGLLGLSVIVAAFLHDGSVEPEEDVPSEVTTDFDEIERAREVIADTERQLSGTEESTETGAAVEGLVEREVSDEEAGGTAVDSRSRPEVVEVDGSDIGSDAPSQPEDMDPDVAEVPEPEPEQEPETAPEEPAEPAFSPGLPAYYRDADWLRSRPEGSHTIQLLGSFNESTAIDFIENHDLDGLVYVRSTHQGRPWFVVIQGEYPNQRAARAGIEELPPEIRELGPWTRSFEGL